MILKKKQKFLGFPLLLLANCIYAQSNEIFNQQESRFFQEEQRMKKLQELNLPQKEQKPLDIENLKTKNKGGLVLNESPCFKINKISLIGNNKKTIKKFNFALSYAKKKSSFKAGMCLGQESISRIVALAQNKIIDKGYTTTQIGLGSQDLNSGELKLTLITGKVGDIKFDNPAGFNNKIPLKKGEIFNLRDLETGLENLQRTPSVNADIKITPSELENSSDILVSYSKNKPFRFSLNLDDSGSYATGKYLVGGSFALDNPLGLSDIFYTSYNHSFSGKKNKYIDEFGEKTDSKTNNYSIHYSFPVYSWQFGANQNFYSYHQAIAGYAENYDYNGESKTNDVFISKNLYRDSHRKTEAKFKLWQRKSKNFIDDAELEIQRKNTAGWAFDINHREYINNAFLNVNVGYKRGTGIFNAQRAIEEEFDEGTSRMSLITADTYLSIPFKIKEENFSFENSIHSQWNKTPLLTQDKISIGGRNTVRGFDGEVSLSAERGFYSQNNINYNYKNSHNLYLGYDIGRVSGESKDNLIAQTLAGTAIGFKGNFKAGGNLYYDFFMGKPLIKPKNYPTHKNSYGFMFNYQL